MATKIGVGVVGASTRGWARAVHIPALQALDGYDIRAVSTTRRETAEDTAQRLGIRLAFDNHVDLIARPEVDLVVVAVNVTNHREIACAAIEAGKMVCCDWPLGRSLSEAREMANVARARGMKTMVDLQGRMSPAALYVRDLVADGYVGRVMGTRMMGRGVDSLWSGLLAPEFEITADPANGNSLLAIVAGHALVMLTHALGNFVSVSSTLIAARKTGVRLRDGASIAFPMHDQVAFSGELENGALASVHYRAGTGVGPDFMWEINGSEGSLLLSANSGYGNIAPLEVRGVKGTGEVQALRIPAQYRHSPAGLAPPLDNVAALYAQFESELAGGVKIVPDFDAALRLHELIDAIEKSHVEGRRQFL